MPFLDHLEELRHRLFWVLGSLFVCMAIAFAVVWQFDIIGLIATPILPYLPEGKLVFTHPFEPMGIVLKVAFGIGLVAASPIIGYQVWAFLAPALHPHEKRVVVPVLAGATLLFAAGVTLCIRFVLPAMYNVLFSFQSASLNPMITAGEYFSSTVMLALAFGGCFQLPIIIFSLSMLGFVTPKVLARYRRHAAVGSFVLGALITPGDMLIVTLMLGLPLYFLYEVGIVLSWFVERRRAKTAATIAAMLLVALTLALPRAGHAQQPQGQPLPQGQRPPPKPDVVQTLGEDALRRDTTGRAATPTGAAGRDERRVLILWDEPDSVMLALLARKGYRVVRYQAESVGFDASTRVMALRTDSAGRAAVERDSTLLVAHRIAYNDSTSILDASGDTIIMRDPTSGDDVIGLGEMSYDLKTREGRLRDFSTVASAGEDWRVTAHRAAIFADSTSDRTIVWGRDGRITSCQDSVPHYHFQGRELKRVSKSILVVRPAILYVEDVPVMWLPFIFQDIRSGRRSGMLTPRLGVSEIVRNSPNYRRTVENIGYYFALNDYTDAQISLDWRSRARETEVDRGMVQLNGELRYVWLDRFLSGGIAVSQHSRSDGSGNTSVAWNHQQQFSSRTRFSSSVNYMTNTSVHRRSTVNPMAAMGTIRSQVNLVRQQGPFAVNVGAGQVQYPGRQQIDREFPTLSVSSKPLTAGDWFVLTPSLSVSGRQQLQMDAVGDFAYRYLNGPGGLDSVRLRRDARTTGVSLNTPFKFFGFQVSTDFRFSDVANEFPEIKNVPDPANPGQTIERVYARTFLSTADYNVSFGLPALFKGTWNLAPSISFVNPAGSGSFVRSERTNGLWVSQAKRANYALTISPTLFRLLPGFGPIERMRHAITPSLSWSYSPAIDVDDEYLLALGQDPARFIGGVASNRLSLGFSTNIEAKMRSRSRAEPAADTGAATPQNGIGPGGGVGGGVGGGAGASADNGQKIRLLSAQFSSVAYDFERARVTGRSGFATDNVSTTLRSDLLPGLDLGLDYSLFQGNILSDTAEFKPYRTAVRFGFQVSDRSPVVRAVARLLGFNGDPAPALLGQEPSASPLDPMGGGQVSSADPFQQGMGAITGSRSRAAVQAINPTSSFTAGFSFSQQRQRPPVGDGRVIQPNPAAECQAYVGLPSYDYCVLLAQQKQNPNPNPHTDGTAGGSFYRVDPVTSLGINTQFKLTPNWAAGWNTTYDMERHRFAAQVITLQRELHDWRAVFGFTQSPNGGVSFTFFVSLKAQPDLKFDYDAQSYRLPAPPSR